MKKFISGIFAIFLFQYTFGQSIEKIYLDQKEKDSNCYLTVTPAQMPVTGFMFLIPGLGQSPEDVLTQTDLPKMAAQSGILTIIPTFKTGTWFFGIDSLTQQSFKEIFLYVTNRYKLIDKPIFVGGFSMGGSCAIKFAELANAENFNIKPSAVFAIDPPLDFERYYYSRKRDIRLSEGKGTNEEAVYMIDRIEKEMKGNPATAQANFYKISPYSFTDNSQTAIKQLLKTPLRIYTEPDVNWWIKERGSDYSGMNALDASAMINELNQLGNHKAFLITTQNKGFRQPGNIRHPHSWSIVDSKEIITWLLRQ